MKTTATRCALALLCALQVAPLLAVTTISISTNVILPGVKRLGLNAGSRDRWGAAQYLKNLLDNPGFEPGVFCMTALADPGGTVTSFVQKYTVTNWANAQPPGFWNGCDYEIVYGTAKGRTGTIASFVYKLGKYQFNLGSSGTVPADGDVMLVRRPYLPGYQGDLVLGATNDVRPGSPGIQSYHLTNTAHIFKFVMDTTWRDNPDVFTNVGTKFLIVKGNWRLQLWARGKSNGDQLRARFYRENQADFISQTMTLGTNWQSFSFTTYVAPETDSTRRYTTNEYHPALVISLQPLSGEAWMDDFALECTDHSNTTAFTDSFVNRLRELNPGVLRFWGGQLGNDFANQIAEPWARKTSGYHINENKASGYAYSFHDFLALCQIIGAEPWYVMPVTYSPADLLALMEYLGGPADGAHPWADRRAALGQTQAWTQVFNLLHLEYGNEIWGSGNSTDPFNGESVNGGVREGRIAHDRFAILKTSPFYTPTNFNLIIGGQASYPGRQTELEQNCTNHDELALASYYGSMQTGTSDEQLFPPIYAWPTWQITSGNHSQSWANIKKYSRGTRWATYEANFGEGSDTVAAEARNGVIAGAGGGISLPLHLLVNQRDLRSYHQCIFSALQFISPDGVRLWGTLRDVEYSGWKRPTWLAAEIANTAIKGDLITTTHSGDNPGWTQPTGNGIVTATAVKYLQSFAYQTNGQFALVLFNVSLTGAYSVVLRLPSEPDTNATQSTLFTSDIHANNETNVQVAIVTTPLAAFSNNYQLTIPPHAMTAVLWSENGIPEPLCLAGGALPLCALARRMKKVWNAECGMRSAEWRVGVLANRSAEDSNNAPRPL